MTNLSDRLMSDLKDAMRSQQVTRRGVIRMVRAAIKNAEIDMQREATDGEIQAIVAREIKRRDEAMALFRQGGRQDLVDQHQAEIAVLSDYLPRQLSREEIAEVVRGIVSETSANGPSQLGLVMREAMARLKGVADGKLVNQIAREILSG